MARTISESLAWLDNNLQFQHRSMIDYQNPVLTGCLDNSIIASDLGVVLGQYSLLPAAIVDLLDIGCDRLNLWPSVETELERNIGEELGSRTEGLSHYVILKAALLNELKFDVSHVVPSNCTDRFLSLIREGLSEKPPPIVAGMLYALEASAVPELTIVARIINEYATMAGYREWPIDLSALWTRKREAKTLEDIQNKYCLDSFFASHLLDFEVGHKNGLALAIKQYISSQSDIKSFEFGFEHVLNEMDKWWDSLALTFSNDQQTSHPLITVTKPDLVIR